VLINNGGMGHIGEVLEMDLEIERMVMEVNFWGHVALTKQVLPDMLKRKSGSIVVISSILGHFGSPGLAAYAGSKHAILGYFESLREEYHAQGIHVLLACPGFVNTQVTLSSVTANGQRYGKNSVAQEKGMKPEVFASKLIRKIEANKNYVFIGRSEILSVPFKHFAPNLFFWLMRLLTKRARRKKS
jgi:short-subunit dehydrogenase